MLKLLLMMVLGAGCTLMGFVYADRLKGRVVAIEGMLCALKQLEMLISYSAPPLREIAHALSGDETTGALWAQLGERLLGDVPIETAWDEAMERAQHGPLGALKAEELRVLREFVPNLGKSDRENQLGNARLAQQRLAAILETTRESAQKRGKMYRSLGALFGLAMGILLW